MNLIKEFRQKHGLSTKELAMLLEKSQRSIQRYETGERNITKDVLYRLDDLSNLTPRELINLLRKGRAKHDNESKNN